MDLSKFVLREKALNQLPFPGLWASFLVQIAGLRILHGQQQIELPYGVACRLNNAEKSRTTPKDMDGELP